jgi:hypothetical protein
MEAAMDISDFAGHFIGEGKWIDVTGESKRYRVDMSIGAREGGLEVAYTHDFFEEGNVTTSEVRIRPAAGTSLLEAWMGGSRVGYGYLFGTALNYHLQFGEVFIEVGYTAVAGGLIVRGSSSRNSKGRYIAWHEDLKPQG